MKLPRALQAISHGFRIIAGGVRYVQRLRNRGRVRPDLRFESVSQPYWGATQLEVSVRNEGSVAARDCRYARLHWFTMLGAVQDTPSMSECRQYATNRFSVPAGGSVRICASLSAGSCSREVLGDLDRPADRWYLDAVVCRDPADAMYRFRSPSGSGDQVDVWSAGLLDRARRRTAPAWTRWVGRQEKIHPVAWSEASGARSGA